MPPKKLFRDFSASTLQVVLNQIFGLLIFYLLSRYLDKSNFGELNWSIATLSVATTLLTLGTDILIVKRIAAGNEAGRMGGLHMSHTLLAAIVFVLGLLACRWGWPEFFKQHNLLVGVGISLLLTFLSSPFKQVANGKEAFRNFAVMTITGNMAKGLLLLVAVLLGAMSIRTVVSIYIIASLIEWLVGAGLVMRSLGTPLKPFWDVKEYKSLLLESFPQLGVLLFDSALARMDWILLGLIKGPARTAEYSFAYKIFEISRLPMLIIAPIILPKFVRYLNSGDSLPKTKKDELNLLLKFETSFAVMIPLFFNMIWTPLMGWLTAGKYGAVDAPVYLLLSLCVPLHYFNNFLWTIAFAQKQLKLTFYITILVSLLNIVLNLVLIPKWSSQGAAMAYLVSTVVQFILYKVFTDQRRLSVPILPLLASIGIAAGCMALGQILAPNPVFGVILASGAYLSIVFLSGLLHIGDFRRLKTILVH
jgi:O-antigen/teichoic acid export membrane protein